MPTTTIIKLSNGNCWKTPAGYNGQKNDCFNETTALGAGFTPDPNCSSYQLSTDASGAAPLAPANLIASSITDSGATLRWTDTNNGTAQHRVERQSSTGWELVTTTGQGVLSYILTGLVVGLYQYRVTAERGGLLSAPSNLASVAITPPVAVPVPTLTFVSSTTGSITATVSDTNINRTGFEYQVSTTGADFDTIAKIPLAGTSLVASGLLTDNPYYIRVRSLATVSGANYTSAWSVVLTTRTAPGAVVPGRPVINCQLRTIELVKSFRAQFVRIPDDLFTGQNIVYSLIEPPIGTVSSAVSLQLNGALVRGLSIVCSAAESFTVGLVATNSQGSVRMDIPIISRNRQLTTASGAEFQFLGDGISAGGVAVFTAIPVTITATNLLTCATTQLPQTAASVANIPPDQFPYRKFITMIPPLPIHPYTYAITSGSGIVDRVTVTQPDDTNAVTPILPVNVSDFLLTV
jgi:hypothetical protein